MNLIKPTRASRWTRRYLAVVAAIGFVSCQNTGTETLDQEVPARVNFSIDKSWQEPDSASYRFKDAAGAAELYEKPGTNAFVASFKLPSAPGNDTVYVANWRYGLRLHVLAATGSGDLDIDSHRVVREHPALDIVQRHDSLYRRDSSFFAASRIGVRRTYAKMLVEGDSLVKGYPAVLPVGIDSSLLIDDICVALARQKTSFAYLYPKSFLGSDSATWRRIVLDRIASKRLTSADSAILFPPPPVRVLTEIVVKNSLVAGGDESTILGAFAWDSGMVVLDAEVLKAGEVVKGAVDVALWQSQSNAEAKWDLQGKASIRARSKTVAGDYQLRITARDAKGNFAVSTAPFTVADPPANAPRLAVIDPSGSDTIRLPFGKENVHVVARLRNPSEVKLETFAINGIKPVSVDDSTWSADVPVPPTGNAVIIGARVEGANGVVASEYFLAVRAKDAEAPKCVRGTGAVDAVVPFDTSSIYASWTVSDNHKLGEVKIAGVPAVALGSTWFSRVPLVVGKNVVRLEAFDSTGNKSVDSIVIARAKDLQAPVITALEGTESQELVGEADQSVMVNWNVTDNHKVEKVEIAGEPAVHAGASNVWFRYIVVKEGDNKIVVRAWDSTGNQSVDSIVIRKSVNPDHPVLKAMTGTVARTLPFDTTSVEVGWQVLNPKCLGAVEIAGVATKGQDGKFQRKIQLPVGDTTIVVVARDTLGNISRASVKITRKRDTIAPKCAAGPGSAVIADGKIRATVSWVVTDNHLLKSVKIEGVEATSVGNVYGRTVEVPLDQEWIRIVATDSCDNQTRDSVKIVGSPDTLAPRIYAGLGANNRTVGAEVAQTVVSWTVVDDRDVSRVEIAGKTVDPVGAVYGSSVELVVGKNAIRIDAQDAAGNKSSSEVVIYRQDANGPEIVMVQAPSQDTLPEATEALDLFFKVADAQGVKSVKIGGKEIQGTAGVYNASVPLAFGMNSIEIQALDADGALSAKIIEVVRRDETAPVVKAKFGTGIQVGGLVTEYDLSWEVSDNSGAFTATLDGKPIVCADGICNATVPLVVGANQFVFEAKDATGLATKSVASIARNDELAPVVAIVAPTDIAQPVVVGDAAPKTVLRWTAQDNMAVTSSTANGKVVTKTDAGEYLLEIDMTGRYLDSVVTIFAKDAEGNSSVAKTVTIRHPDLVPPSIAMVAPAPPTIILGATDASPKAVVRWTVSDNSTTFTTTANGKSVAPSASGEYAVEIDMTGRYADSTVVIAAKDAAGNSAASISVSVHHADETAPKLIPVEPAVAGGTVWVKAGQNSASVKWKVDEAVGLASCTYNGVAVAVDASGNFVAPIDMAGKVGDSLVKIVAKDKAGNVSTELVVTVRRDITKPVVTKIAPVPANSIEPLPTGTTLFTVKWSAVDAGQLASTTINGVEFAAKAVGDYSLPIDMSLKEGDSAISIVAKDMAGNVSAPTTFAIRRDVTPPAFVGLPTDTVFVMGTPAGVQFTWDATDKNSVTWCGVNGQQVTKGASGSYSLNASIAKIGDTTIVFSAKDAAGNVAEKKVVVRHDVKAPTVVPSATTKDTLIDADVQSYTVSWTVSDNDKIAGASIDGITVLPVKGVVSKTIQLDDNPKQVQLKVNDRAGNLTGSTVTLARRVVRMAVGGYFGLHLDKSGNVTLWGGEGIELPSDLGKVRDIAAAGRSAFFLKDDGSIVASGDGTGATLPVIPSWSGVQRIFAGTTGTNDATLIGVLSTGKIVAAGTQASADYVKAAVAAVTKASKVALGAGFIIVLDKDTIATSWVPSTGGVLSTDYGKAKTVAGSYSSGVVLKAGGAVENVAGSMVSGGAGVRYVDVGLYQACGFTEAGAPVNWTNNSYGTSYGQGYFYGKPGDPVKTFPSDVVAVASGFRFNAFLTSQGKVAAFGESKAANFVPASILWVAP